MKSRLMVIVLTVLLSAFMAACASNNSNPDPNSGNVPAAITPASSPSPDGDNEAQPQTPSDNEPASNPFQDVLLNNATFFSTDNKQDVFLNDFLTSKALYETVFEVSRFAVLDMDGDQTPEVVLELTVQGNPQFYEVLHLKDGVVYGYNIVFRGLQMLKADGTFSYSGGAADNGYGKLTFQPDSYETTVLGYMESSQNDDGMTISYYIDNQPVTEEAYDAFSKEQDAKEDVVWHEFSQANIEAELAVTP